MRAHFPYLMMAALAAGLISSPVSAAEPPGMEASLQVYSVHFSRTSGEFSKRFPNRYYYDNNAGVSMVLLLTLNEGTLLPLSRDAVSIDTFVDDTYQNLNVNDPNRFYSSSFGPSGQGSVSQDGHSLLFTVNSSRSPADEAGRVFVRGTLQARISRGDPIVVSNQLVLAVGGGTMVGPFRTVLRSLSDQGNNGALSLTLAVDNESWRIQKARLLDSSGKVLSDERAFRIDNSGTPERSSTAFMTIPNAPTNAVTVEFTYLEKVENVRIPFEAQVDVGVAKAGPIEPGESKPVKKGGTRTWPPPREMPETNMPPRRAAFDPAAKLAKNKTASAPLKLDKASVDLFSLTVAKPAPGEVRGVTWKNPPSPAFYPSGFTMARLLLSVPGASIISVPSEGITINRFEDDKGGKLDTTLYRDSYSSYPAASAGWRSPDEQQTLLNVSLASAPTPGATRCTLTGEVEAKVARGIITNSSPAMEFKRGQSFTAGPYTLKLDLVRPSVLTTPASQENGQVEAWLTITGPGEKIRSIEFLDQAGQPIVMARTDYGSSFERDQSTRRPYRFSSMPSGPVALRVRSYESTETVKVPFELNTGIGL